VTIFHIQCEASLKTNLLQGILASVRSLVYHGCLGRICFIHARSALAIKAAGIQLQNEISELFPANGWEKLKRYQTMIQKYNNYSGNVVSIALLFYFAATASSCLTLGMYDGWDRLLLVILIVCPATIIFMVIFFSSVVSTQGKQIVSPLYFILDDTLHSRLDHCELGSEIGGFAVSTTRFLRWLLGLGGFVFTLIPIASWINRLIRI